MKPLHLTAFGVASTLFATFLSITFTGCSHHKPDATTSAGIDGSGAAASNSLIGVWMGASPFAPNRMDVRLYREFLPDGTQTITISNPGGRVVKMHGTYTLSGDKLRIVSDSAEGAQLAGGGEPYAYSFKIAGATLLLDDGEKLTKQQVGFVAPAVTRPAGESAPDKNGWIVQKVDQPQQQEGLSRPIYVAPRAAPAASPRPAYAAYPPPAQMQQPSQYSPQPSPQPQPTPIQAQPAAAPAQPPTQPPVSPQPQAASSRVQPAPTTSPPPATGSNTSTSPVAH